MHPGNLLTAFILGQTHNNKLMLKNNQNFICQEKYMCYLHIYIFVIKFKNLGKGIYIQWRYYFINKIHFYYIWHFNLLLKELYILM